MAEPISNCGFCGEDGTRAVIVGFSGGVTSAWCAAWALRTFSRDSVTLLFHDTKEEDEDTYRFMREVAERLGHPIVERSDGRSVTQVARDEGAIPNNRMAFCSRILKAEQRDRYMAELRALGCAEIINVVGFTAVEWQRIQRASMRAEAAGYKARFPCAENGVTKQDCIDWCIRDLGVRPPAIYQWSEHANCLGCVRGGKSYWLAVRENAPDAFARRVALEAEFGHTILKESRLIDIQPLKRKVKWREEFEVPCECVG